MGLGSKDARIPAALNAEMGSLTIMKNVMGKKIYVIKTVRLITAIIASGPHLPTTATQFAVMKFRLPTSGVMTETGVVKTAKDPTPDGSVMASTAISAETTSLIAKSTVMTATLRLGMDVMTTASLKMVGSVHSTSKQGLPLTFDAIRSLRSQALEQLRADSLALLTIGSNHNH